MFTIGTKILPVPRGKFYAHNPSNIVREFIRPTIRKTERILAITSATSHGELLEVAFD